MEERSPFSLPLVVLVSLLGAVGCQSTEMKACHAAMTASQASLLSINKTDKASVESVLAEVEKTRDVCAKAALKAETKDTEEAVRNLKTLLELQEERAKRAKIVPPTPEEEALLAKKGDPTCPRGEAYQLGEPPKLIRCTGSTLFEMEPKAAREALERDGFRLLTAPTEKIMKAEHGSKTFVLEYARADASDPPVCLRALAKPGVPWQETAARLLGVPPQKLMLGKKVGAKRGEILVQTEGAPPQETVLLGDCQRWVEEKPAP